MPRISCVVYECDMRHEQTPRVSFKMGVGSMNIKKVTGGVGTAANKRAGVSGHNKESAYAVPD